MNGSAFSPVARAGAVRKRVVTALICCFALATCFVILSPRQPLPSAVGPAAVEVRKLGATFRQFSPQQPRADEGLLQAVQQAASLLQEAPVRRPPASPEAHAELARLRQAVSEWAVNGVFSLGL